MDKLEQRARTFLDRWSGGLVQISGFEPDLLTLSLKITKEGRPGFMELACICCEHVSGPTWWKEGTLEFVRRQKPNGDFHYFVWDMRAHFFAYCEKIESFETENS